VAEESGSLHLEEEVWGEMLLLCSTIQETTKMVGASFFSKVHSEGRWAVGPSCNKKKYD